MITHEQTVEAAKRQCTPIGTVPDFIKDYGIYCFVDGARWRIESIWRPINEKPKSGKHILVHFGSGNFTSWYASDDILFVFKKFEVVEWVYIDDLLPETKKEEK